MDVILELALGVGLAAACGFRVFVPLLVLSLAARAGYVPLAGGFEWMARTGALVVFATATVAEVLAYYVPWLDHALDVIAGPAAVVAGMIVSASVIADLPPLLKWTAVVIGGGGAAAAVQGSTMALRAGSTLTTGGLGNAVVATGELSGAVLTAVLAVLVPIAATVFAAVVVILVYRTARRALSVRRRSTAVSATRV